MCYTDIPHPPGKPEVTDSKTNHISIKWTPPEEDGGSLVTGYNVQRQDPKTRKWTKLNSDPLLVTSYSCSIPTGRDGVIDVTVSVANGLELVLVADVS